MLGELGTGENGLLRPECHLPSAIVLVGLETGFPSYVPRVSPVVDCFATCPSGDTESVFASTPSPSPSILTVPVVASTAGAWNRRELGFLRLAGWEVPWGLASGVLRLGSWLFRSNSFFFTHFNEDNLVPGWVCKSSEASAI